MFDFFSFEDVEDEKQLNFGKSYIKSFNHTEIDDFGLVKETAKEKQAKALIKIYQAITAYMKELRDLQKVQRDYIRYSFVTDILIISCTLDNDTFTFN